MANIIKPKDFLIQQKNKGSSAETIRSSDLLEITELDVIFPFSNTLNATTFYDDLKKAVSDFNSDAALSGSPLIDFDDIHTRYSEYVEVLKTFIPKSD